MKKPFVILSKRLERGTILWLFVCVLAIFMPRIAAIFMPQDLSYEWTYVQERKVKHAFTERNTASQYNLARFKPLWKRCAPELLSAADWQRLGLSSKQAASLLRYRDKYGFYSIEQMRRIRVLPAALLNLISDSLLFAAHSNEDNKSATAKEARGIYDQKNVSHQKINKLDLNAATTGMLVALPGLGEYTAAKIIAYRERLGGFLSLDQLQEIQGLKPETLEKVLPFLTLEQAVKHISINVVTYETLKQHPYLTWNQANSIIKMRKQRGQFKDLEELKESVLIDDETYKKLLPYVSL
jgi:competence ComEA-like helix-hairpin-helix protein